MLQSQVLGQDVIKRTSKFFVGHWPPQIYPHVYLTSYTWLFLPGLPPTASDQKLEAGTAWKQGYSSSHAQKVKMSLGMRLLKEGVGGRTQLYLAAPETGAFSYQVCWPMNLRTERSLFFILCNVWIKFSNKSENFQPCERCPPTRSAPQNQLPTRSTSTRPLDQFHTMPTQCNWLTKIH